MRSETGIKNKAWLPTACPLLLCVGFAGWLRGGCETETLPARRTPRGSTPLGLCSSWERKWRGCSHSQCSRRSPGASPVKADVPGTHIAQLASPSKQLGLWGYLRSSSGATGSGYQVWASHPPLPLPCIQDRSRVERQGISWVVTLALCPGKPPRVWVFPP